MKKITNMFNNPGEYLHFAKLIDSRVLGIYVGIGA